MAEEVRFIETEISSPIAEITLLLCGCKDGHRSTLGTGVVIGSYVAITARHVIDEYFRYYDTDDHHSQPTQSTATFSLEALHVIKDGSVGWIWSVTQIYYSNITDIVFFRLDQTNEDQNSYKFPCIKMSIEPPSIGTNIAAFGYICSEILNENNAINLLVKGHTSTGIVKEIYHERRDSSLINFPCFRSNVRFDGGMSGGPVMNSEGKLCGLICANSPPSLDDPQGEHDSYITTLWPMLAIPVSFNRDGYSKDIS